MCVRVRPHVHALYCCALVKLLHLESTQQFKLNGWFGKFFGTIVITLDFNVIFFSCRFFFVGIGSANER